MFILEFIRCFGTVRRSAEAVKQTRLSDGFRCQRCDGTDHCVLDVGVPRPFQWYGLGHQASLTAGSLMEDIKLPLTTWSFAVYLISEARTGLGWRSSDLWVSAVLRRGCYARNFAVPWPNWSALTAWSARSNLTTIIPVATVPTASLNTASRTRSHSWYPSSATGLDIRYASSSIWAVGLPRRPGIDNRAKVVSLDPGASVVSYGLFAR